MTCPLGKQSVYGFLSVQSNPNASREDIVKAAGTVICNYQNRSMTIAELNEKIVKNTPYSMIYEQYEVWLIENISTACRELSAAESDALLVYSGYKDADFAEIKRQSDAAVDTALEALSGRHPDEDCGEAFSQIQIADRTSNDFTSGENLTFSQSPKYS